MRECLAGVGLLCMDTLSCIHGHTFLHSWSGAMTLVVGLLHGATFLSNLPLVLFVSFIRPSLIMELGLSVYILLKWYYCLPCCPQVILPTQLLLRVPPQLLVFLLVNISLVLDFDAARSHSFIFTQFTFVNPFETRHR